MTSSLQHISIVTDLTVIFFVVITMVGISAKLSARATMNARVVALVVEIRGKWEPGYKALQ